MFKGNLHERNSLSNRLLVISGTALGRRLAVHAQSLTVRIGSPIRYNPINNPAKERARLKNLLEHTIHNMILQTSHGEIVQLPLLN